jgi:hypothetical protein
MKFWKHTLVTSFAFFCICSMATYTACVKDGCADAVCQNGGGCTDGVCACPAGYEGASCEIKSATKFVGRFIGSTQCDTMPPFVDTIDIAMVNNPNYVRLIRHTNITDTLYGVVTKENLAIGSFTSGVYRRTYSVNVQTASASLRLTYAEVTTPDTTVSYNYHCNFLGFKTN